MGKHDREQFSFALRQTAEVTFQKIDVNPLSATYVDQVLWGKSVAPFAVPLDQGVPGRSGTSTPIVQRRRLAAPGGHAESL